jgi:hypothetical protein
MIPPAFQRRGRPPVFGHLFTLTVDDETDAAIRDYARSSNNTVAAALRDLIEWGLESLSDGGATSRPTGSGAQRSTGTPS